MSVLLLGSFVLNVVVMFVNIHVSRMNIRTAERLADVARDKFVSELTRSAYR